jgi:Zn-dependent oligopeptidase
MANCAVATTREKLSVTRETAYGDNLSLVAEGVGYRKQIAAMLGYPSWSHFVTETRMSGSPEVVVEFMDKIRDLAMVCTSLTAHGGLALDSSAPPH